MQGQKTSETAVRLFVDTLLEVVLRGAVVNQRKRDRTETAAISNKQFMCQ